MAADGHLAEPGRGEELLELPSVIERETTTDMNFATSGDT